MVIQGLKKARNPTQSHADNTKLDEEFICSHSEQNSTSFGKQYV